MIVMMMMIPIDLTLVGITKVDSLQPSQILAPILEIP